MTNRQRTLEALMAARQEIESGVFTLIGDSLNPKGQDARELLLKPILKLIDATIERVSKCDWGNEP